MALSGQKFLIPVLNRTVVVPEPPYSPDFSPAEFCCSETGDQCKKMSVLITTGNTRKSTPAANGNFSASSYMQCWD
jgi:hypothetical protein